MRRAVHEHHHHRGCVEPTTASNARAPYIANEDVRAALLKPLKGTCS